MAPPNLRIWAERKYRVEKGITQGEDREYLIGQEGGATTSDSQIVIYTEWLDQDGTPLPSELGKNNGKDLGLTGSLQKVIGPNKLGKPGGSIHQFGIKPGLQTQVINLPNNSTDAGHFYVHVIGEPINQDCKTCANFDRAHPNPVYAGRPRYSVPFYVPVASEDVHQLELFTFNRAKDKLIELGNSAELAKLIKPKGFHNWLQRPEYAFSVLDLQVKEILRETYDTEGDLIDSIDIIDQSVPIISSTDYLEVLYSLNQGTGGVRLPTFDTTIENDLVFEVAGGHEIQAQIGSDQTIRFEDLGSLDALEAGDLLMLSLLSNNDPTNTLWEWVFQKNGLLVYYSVPGNPGPNETGCSLQPLPSEGKKIPLKTIPPYKNKVVQTLGGMRLKYKYKLPCSVTEDKLVKVIWKFNHPGRYCKEYGVNRVGRPATLTSPAVPVCKTLAANVEYESEDASDLEIYWEPVDGPDVKWVDDLDVVGLVYVKYVKPGATFLEEKNTEFHVVTRELVPDAANPMQGSDVEMLESILWQLGISPQYGFPGSEGDRIGSGTVPDPLGNMQEKSPRNKYLPGFAQSCADNNAQRTASIEKMVRRFKGHHTYPGSNSFCKGNKAKTQLKQTAQYKHAGGESSTGVVDSDMLKLLAVHYRQYIDAVMDGPYAGLPRIVAKNNLTRLRAAATAAADNFWDENDVYSNDKHAAIYGEQNRAELLAHWINRETAHTFWGGRATGFKGHEYRMSLGGSDEYASMGYNHIIAYWVYGAGRNGCPELNAIDSDLASQYNPDSNADNFTLFTGLSSGLCDRSIYKAFNDARSVKSYINSSSTHKVLGDCRQTNHSLTDCDGVAYTSYGINAVIDDDDYDLMAKAIMSYNAGPAILRRNSWLGYILGSDPSKIDKSVRQHYTIGIRKDAGLTRKKYAIYWRDATMSDVLLNSNFTAGQELCVMYSEDDFHVSRMSVSAIMGSVVDAANARVVSCQSGVKP